ncbi:MAG: acyltransferase [Roseburia sp.]|nr:acyltransferase [Roseburia sp.]
MNTIKEKQRQDNPAKKRMLNLELLRCVAMMMVVVLHYLGKGGLLGDLAAENLGAVNTAAWALEVLCIVAVNLYMLLSGYLLCESPFKLSRLLSLLLQIWMYSMVFGLAAAALGLVPAEELTTYYYLRLLFPVSMGHYWFMTAYVFLYLLLPFVGMAIKRMSKRQLQLAVILLLFPFCVMKSVLPVRLDMDEKGYDCLWYLCVFLAGAYIRRFGLTFLQKKKRGVCLYLLASVLAFTCTMLLRRIYLRTGSLGLLLGVCLEYNHLLPFLASVGLFLAFLGLEIKGKGAQITGRMAPLTLGVYLLHENLGLRYAWQPWLGAGRIEHVAGLFGGTIIAVAAVFGAGITVEALRRALTRGLHKILLGTAWYRRLTGWLQRMDLLYAQEAGLDGDNERKK